MHVASFPFASKTYLALTRTEKPRPFRNATSSSLIRFSVKVLTFGRYGAFENEKGIYILAR